MSLSLKQIVLNTRRILVIIFIIFGFIWAGYSYLESDRGLLRDETLIAIISDDVLGEPVYGKSCSRSAYKNEVEIRPGGDKASGYFIFNPVVGQESHCPPIAIIANRRTGEAWIADPPQQ